jgi:hypothetical protein
MAADYGQVLQPLSADEQRPGRGPPQPSGQVVPSQLAPVPVPTPTHVTSHAHESKQSVFWHDCRPVHPILHAPGPHTMSRHDWTPLHAMLHDAAEEQSTPCAHELAVVQPMVQFHPAGQMTSLLQLVVAQSITHSCFGWLQLVHCDGQNGPSIAPSRGPSEVGPSVRASIVPPGTTQKPSVQTRPGKGSQSDGTLHWYSPLLWLIEQLLAVTTAMRSAASQATTSFMACSRW